MRTLSRAVLAILVCTALGQGAANACIGCDIGKRAVKATPALRPVPPRSTGFTASWRAPEPPQRAVARTPRVASPTRLPRLQAPVAKGDFWWHLAKCESGVGQTSQNMFQFMGGTEKKVGYHSGASYEEQKAMAQDWASRIDNPGSTAGWPVCWWVAKRNAGYAPK